MEIKMSLIVKIKKLEFEARIFVSFSIVILVCVTSFVFFSHFDAGYIYIFKLFELEKHASIMFLFASALMVAISILRMWAGSLLSSKTVMSFKVQSDSLIISGPYLLVRNPIYFSDLLALSTLALFLPVTGLLMPILFYIHYIQLIKYEEEAFSNNHPAGYSNYLKEVPRLIPTLKSFTRFIKNRSKVLLNKDGVRHNALFVLFIPGFIIGYFTESFLYVVLIGIPAVLDWAIVHTKIGLPKRSARKKKSKVFNEVLYSQCWEDPQIDREAFNIQKDDVVFSITSGGCNLLAFLIDDPKSIIALDLNPHQNYLLELKMAAFKCLSYDNLLKFLGVRKSGNRIAAYDVVKYSLSEEALIFWNGNLNKIEKGIIHCGRYEKYMRLLRICLRFLVSTKTLKKFFETEEMNQRKYLYERKWNNWRWKLFTKILLSRKTMSLLFDDAFFKYLKEEFSFGDHFSEKAKRALIELPSRENYFLRYILLGNYDEKFLPPYLRKKNFTAIKSRLDKIRIVTDGCDNFFSQLPDNSISKFNFTNIFEWISEEAFENLLKETIRVAKNGSVITYRNLLVPREHPESLSAIICSEKELASQLHQRDLSFIYNNYIVEIIGKKEEKCLTELLKYQHEES
jgi:S-adenosylmethionine-diacylglycerol 3-amino-3-carboxypropyl transferase